MENKVTYILYYVVLYQKLGLRGQFLKYCIFSRKCRQWII